MSILVSPIAVSDGSNPVATWTSNRRVVVEWLREFAALAAEFCRVSLVAPVSTMFWFVSHLDFDRHGTRHWVVRILRITAIGGQSIKPAL